MKYEHGADHRPGASCQVTQSTVPSLLCRMKNSGAASVTAVVSALAVCSLPADAFFIAGRLPSSGGRVSSSSRQSTCESSLYSWDRASSLRFSRSATRAAARNRGLTSVQSASTATTTSEQAATHGSVTFLPENDELAAEETVEIIYTPPAGLFEGADSLLYCGGFNGWDGEEDGVTMPMMPVGDEGNFRISINVPNFARVLDFVVTDGVRYDTGPEGLFYHAMVTHVREADKAGNIITYRQEADGTLIKTGIIEKVDPQELERMMDEATKTQAAAAAPPPVADPMVDETMAEVEQGLRQEITVTIDEQDAVQKMRAEASVLGERLGLGNMQVNEARDAFDVHDNEQGLLAFEDVGKVLDKLGFQDELDSAQLAELIGTHVLEKRPDADTMTLTEFMYLFKALDDLDIGIDIC
ncbi:unnamed protein product [Ectocarpus sp. 12 AP-2014]